MRFKAEMVGLAAVMVFAGYGFAADTSAPAAVKTHVKAKAVEVGNTVCPVSNEKIGAMGKSVSFEYNGKQYNLCCDGCVAPFKADPEKYSKIAEDSVKKAVK